MWLLVLFCLLIGLLIGMQVPVFLSVVYAKYMSIAVIAALDAVFGGIRAYMEDNFDTTIFVSGFVVNTLLAAGMAYLGDRLGVQLYLAAVVVFGVRIFQNLGIIRRYLLKKY
ncbi:MAG: small basic family protein [Syntrophomonas sp.]|nr:small basic family protein [Syntrophomonas sp.]MDD2509654.1 small basic family protein [Syntrophomonas sp.]MDD3878489.1 small basic family protein [Syntrophomonas sp.]MDD4625684.1 small basic family protein [Syntrophomonas sp.]